MSRSKTKQWQGWMKEACRIFRLAAGYGSALDVTTLYDRWRATVRNHRHDFALRDVGADLCWTFSELAAAAEAEANPDGPVAFPRGSGVGFILTVLRAWRSGQIVCPLEEDQPIPGVPWPAAPIVHLKTTSGTTGRSRLIAFTAEQLASDASDIVVTMGLRPDWPNLGVISLAHSYGFSNLVTPLLLHGIPLILGVPPLPEAVRLATRDLTTLTLPAVPALWRVWHRAKAIPSGTRLAISAGAVLPLPLEKEIFETTGLKIHNFYGASECGGIAYDGSLLPRTDPARVGAPLSQASLNVAIDGCLDVRGPGVATGYWPEPSPALCHPTFRTNDLARLQEGEVYLLGRAGGLINVAGRKVRPEVIEQALLEHPRVREIVVLGLPARDAREEDVAAVISVSGPVLEAELRQFLLARLPAWQVPRHWRLRTEPLADIRGKIAREKWAALFQGR